MAGIFNRFLQTLLQLVQLVLDVTLEALPILDGKGGEGIKGLTFLEGNLLHGTVVGLTILLLQFLRPAHNGLLDRGQGPAVAGSLLRQLTGKLLQGCSALIQFPPEIGNLGGEVFLQIFYPNACIVVEFFQSLVKGMLQLGNILLGTVLQLEEGLILQALGLLGGV